MSARRIQIIKAATYLVLSALILGTPAIAAARLCSTSNSISMCADGSTVAGTVSLSVTLTGQATHAAVYLDGSYQTSIPPSPWSWDTTRVANGSHTVSINVYSSTGGYLSSDSSTMVVKN